MIIDRANDDTDTSFFTDNYLRTTAVPGCFPALRALVEESFGSNVHVVSKCGPNVERKTREWLAHHDFYALTGVASSHVHFTRTREGKAPICAELGLTHFIDDRLDVLEHLEHVTSMRHRLLFVGGLPSARRRESLPEGITVVESWPDVARLLGQRPAP